MSSIKVMYTNADGITNKGEELKERVAEAQPHIIAITETKLTSIIGNAIFPRGYQVLRKDRVDRGGGGVALLLQPHWSFEEIRISEETDQQEYILGIAVVGGVKIVVAVIYNPPMNNRRPREEYDKSNENCLKVMEKAATVARGVRAKILILGDFNHREIDWINKDPHGGDETWRAKLVDTADKHFLRQHITEPTRVRGKDPPATLDLVFTQNEADIENIEYEMPLGASDHCIIKLEYIMELKELVRPGNTLRKKRDYRRGDYVKVRDYLSKVEWERELEGKTTHEMMEFIAQKCADVTEQFIPLRRELDEKSKVNPWFNRQCREAKERTGKAWKKYRELGSEENRETLKRVRNEYTRVRREAEKQFENDIAAKAKDHPKLFYSHIRRKATVRDHVIRLKRQGGILTENDKEVCEELNKRFQEVFTKEPVWRPELSNGRPDVTLDDIVVTVEEVKKHLEELDATKSIGPDLISPWLLKEAAGVLCHPLTKIFNKTLETGNLPESWKKANVVPIFKKGDRQEALNYRPVSLTSIPCKVMEKVIRLRIIEHLERIHFVISGQHGFRRGKSCLTNLIEFYDKVTKIRQEKEGWVDCIFLDCQKAFDTVPHERLMFKMEKQAGITGKTLNWIRDYLKDRMQRVTVRDEASTWRNVTSGVPQGSVLGPLLFLIYVNDLPEGVSSFMSMFADDAKLMRHVKTEEDCRRLQEDLDTLQEWSNEWLLDFNPNKCKIMKMGKGERRPESIYTIKGRQLQESEREKDLGVDIIPSLSPEAHINRITAAAYGTLANIRTSFRNLNQCAFKAIYTAFVRPILEYAAPAWNPHLVKHKTKIEKVQRFATRLVPELKGLSYEERLGELDLTTLEERRNRGDMIATYKILRGIDKVDKDSLFKVRGNRTRGHKWKLETQMSRRNVRKYSFPVRVVNKWNALKEEVVEANSIHNFKARFDKN